MNTREYVKAQQQTLLVVFSSHVVERLLHPPVTCVCVFDVDGVYELPPFAILFVLVLFPRTVCTPSSARHLLSFLFPVKVSNYQAFQGW